MLVLGRLQQLLHPDACVRMGAKQRRIITVSRELNIHTDEYFLQVVGEEDSVPHCNWVHRCGVALDTAFHPAQLLDEGSHRDVRLVGFHQPHEGCRGRYTWVNDDDKMIARDATRCTCPCNWWRGG